jgi:hypothetical protein
MPTIVTTTQTRPLPTVSFHPVSDTVKQYTQTNYQDTGKLLSIETSMSSNNLSKITTLTFANNQAYQDYLADATIFASVAEGRNYNSLNGITHSRTIVDA